MAKRRKRLQKGIDSLQREIEIHEKKKQLAQELGKEELVGYYDKEIKALKERKKNREELFKKL